ncbi:hypothetical protein STAQ_26170 [Allostella sp. ATCC 35155]|nr:hypothetical protein STAQ_26170 [Stella sp. ATCC 35155]
MLRGQRTLAVRATILAIGVLLLCFMWVYVLFQSRAEREQAIAGAVRDTANLAIAFEEQTQRTIGAVEQALELLQAEYERAPQSFDVRDAFERIRSLRDITFQLSLIGPDGTMRASSLDDWPRNLDLSDREHFRVHVGSDSRSVFISAPLIGRASGRASINISRRLNRPDGGLAGVLVFSFNPEMLVRMYENVDLGRGGEMLLVGQDGIVRAIGSGDEKRSGQSIADTPFFARIRSAQRGTAELPGPIDMVERLYAFQSVDGLPLLVAVGISKQEVLEPVTDRERNRLALLGAVTAAIVMFLAALVVEVGRRQQREEELERERETLARATVELEAAKAEADEKALLFETTLLNMSDGISFFDADLRLRLWNRRFLELAGVDDAIAVVGTPLEEILRHQAERGEFGPVDPAAEAKRRVAEVRRVPIQGTERRRPNGRFIELRRTVQPDGSIITVYTDVTLRKHSEGELQRARDLAEQALAAKSRFLAIVSHEIRTPMNGVIGTLELLADTNLDRAQRRYVEIARSSADGLVNIINDILDLSRLEADRMPLVTADFDLPALLNSAVGLFSAAADSKGIEIHLAVARDVPRWCRGDAGRLRQILINLLSNAIKFTTVGNVRLSVETVSSRRSVGDGPFELRFLVADSGPGVAPADREKLFRPFFQIDSQEARPGSGLGLAIVKGLVDRFGGSVGVAERPGGGSIFWVRLPLLPGAPTAEEVVADPPPVERSGAAAFNILVAEDSPVNQLIAGEQLRSAGHTVTLADNGREAVEKATAGGFDLILMDVIMPEMDGIDAARAIRRLPPPAGTVPIVALTANVMSEDRARILTSGMDGVLGKPFNRARLLDMVARFARHPGDAGDVAAPAGAADPIVAGPAADAPAAEEVVEEFDPAPLDRMRGDVGDEVTARLTRMFSGELADRRGLMAKALEGGNMADLRRVAHTIKGGAQTFGLLRLAKAALELERGVESGAVDRLAELVAIVDREAAQGYELLETSLAASAPSEPA